MSEPEIEICHDPYYNLMGALYDLEREGADPICLDTIKRVMSQIKELQGDYARAIEDAAKMAEDEQYDPKLPLTPTGEAHNVACRAVARQIRSLLHAKKDG